MSFISPVMSAIDRLPPSATTTIAGAKGPDADLRILDDVQEWSAFSRPAPGPVSSWESNIVIEGMHCAACALTVEDALRGVPGVLRAEVSAASQRARVLWLADQVQPSGWMQAVQAAGYRAVPANDAQARARRLAESRTALWRLLVAALCMMQVMMYAYPAYVAAPGDLSTEMAQLLRWASWVLTLPVMLFSCGPFFSNALRDLAQRRISMDLPVALGMLITFGVSSAGTFEPEGIFGAEVYFDSLTMFVTFLLFGRWLETRLRDQTAGALETLMNRLPDSVARLTPQGDFERVPVRRLQPGDVIQVRPGEAFATDGELLLGETRVDESLLTGESYPVQRGPGAAVIAGSHNLLSVVQVRVTQVGPDTRYARIVALMESVSASRPRLARLADRMARPFLLSVLAAAALACAYWWRQDPGHALMVAVAVLVVTCPCALSLATPAAMLAAAGALARRGVLVRRLDAFEALATVDTVIFDKTGTLTRDGLVLAGTQVRAGVTAVQALAQATALAGHSLHPVSRALMAAFTSQQTSASHTDWLALAVTETAGGGVSGRVGYSPDGRDAIEMRLGSAAFCRLVQPESSLMQVFLADAQGWLATFDLQEDLRPDAGATVQALQAAGVSVHLLSGDQPQAVARVARALDITAHAGACTPQDKLGILQRLQQGGRRVAMVGDGLNDGPVLAGAQVSFAFGQAVPLAQAKADFVVPGSQLLAVAQAVLLARRTVGIVRQNLAWAALYNAVCVPLAVAGLLSAWAAGLGMALSSLLVVLNALRLSGKTPLQALS
jgi:Cu2+-exporting ATPase